MGHRTRCAAILPPPCGRIVPRAPSPQPQTAQGVLLRRCAALRLPRKILADAGKLVTLHLKGFPAPGRIGSKFHHRHLLSLILDQPLDIGMRCAIIQPPKVIHCNHHSGSALNCSSQRSYVLRHDDTTCVGIDLNVCRVHPSECPGHERRTNESRYDSTKLCHHIPTRCTRQHPETTPGHLP